MMQYIPFQSLALSLFIVPSVVCGQISDDFNDGDDAGWTRLNPLSGFGVNATYSFPDGTTYRMQATASPNPDAMGQSRVGSLRSDVNYTAFRVSMDLVSFNPAIEQDVGILARVTSPGLGTLNGYSATFDVDEGRIFLSRIDSEEASGIGDADVALDPDKDYRLVFHGYEGRFLAEVFDVADLTSPLVSVEGEDESHPGGTAGLFGNAGKPDGIIDFVMDNYESDDCPDVDQDGMSDPIEAGYFGNLDQPGDGDFDGDGRSNALELEEETDPTVKDSSVEVSQIEVGTELVTVEFKTLTGKSYQLERSLDLESWSVDEEAEFEDLGDGVAEFKTARGSGPEYLRVIILD
ncbi:MAG: hypothetical protein ABF379_05620 [Akkermansiaceae bacterium]